MSHDYHDPYSDPQFVANLLAHRATCQTPRNCAWCTPGPVYPASSNPDILATQRHDRYKYARHYNDQVTKDRRETRHGFHLFLTIVTFGVWAITGWPIAWAWNRFGPRRKTVTSYR